MTWAVPEKWAIFWPKHSFILNYYFEFSYCALFSSSSPRPGMCLPAARLTALKNENI